MQCYLFFAGDEAFGVVRAQDGPGCDLGLGDGVSRRPFRYVWTTHDSLVVLQKHRTRVDARIMLINVVLIFFFIALVDYADIIAITF